MLPFRSWMEISVQLLEYNAVSLILVGFYKNLCFTTKKGNHVKCVKFTIHFGKSLNLGKTKISPDFPQHLHNLRLGSYLLFKELPWCDQHLRTPLHSQTLITSLKNRTQSWLSLFIWWWKLDLLLTRINQNQVLHFRPCLGINVQLQKYSPISLILHGSV